MTRGGPGEAPAVLWDAGGVVAAAKPAGIETVTQDGTPSFADAIRRLLDAPDLMPAHRLDRDTSGAQLFARDPAALARLEDGFRHRRIKKTYWALCLGRPAADEGTVARRLSAWSGGRRPVRVDARGKPATTAYRVLAVRASDGELPALCRVAFMPREGRTHQIRVHAEAWGHPLAGDHQYGDREANRRVKARTGLSRQALHAWRVAWPEGGGLREVVCPLPADLADVVARLWPGQTEMEVEGFQAH